MTQPKAESEDVERVANLIERLRDSDTIAAIDAWGVRTGVLETRELSMDIINERKEAANELERLRAAIAPLNEGRGDEPLREPLADCVFAADEISRLLPRLRPIRNALERFQVLHAELKRAKVDVAALSAENADLREALKELAGYTYAIASDESGIDDAPAYVRTRALLSRTKGEQ